MNTSALPDHVEKTRENILKDKKNELYEITKTLTESTPELVKMWNSIYKHHPDPYDDLWVVSFLNAAKDARTRPLATYKPKKKVQNLIKKLEKHSEALITVLKENELDFHLIRSNTKNFHGFFVYEDFSERNKSEIDDNDTPKIKFSELIKNISETCQSEIQETTKAKKNNKRVKAVMFIRELAKHTESLYGSPLNSVLAIAANTIFEFEYSESDIANLRNRQ